MENVGTYCRENELLLNLKKGKTEAMIESLRSVIMVLRSLLCQSMSTGETSLIVHLRYSLNLIELINEQATVCKILHALEERKKNSCNFMRN